MPTVTSENAQEFYASRLPPREEAPADDTPAQGKTETKPEGETPQSKEDRVKKVAPRIAELVGERNAARTEAEVKAAEAQAAAQEAQDLRERLERAEQQLAALSQPTEQQQASPRPERKNFPSDDAYTDALTDWKVDQRIAADKVKDAEQRRAAAQAEVAKNWKTQIDAAKADFPDLEEVIGSGNTVFQQVVLYAIVVAGALVAYLLAKYPVEARRIAALRNSAAIAAVLKLSDQLAADGGKSAAPTAPAPTPAAKGESFKAPEPIDHLKGGSPVVGKDESEMTHEEWVAARKAGRIR